MGKIGLFLIVFSAFGLVKITAGTKDTITFDPGNFNTCTLSFDDSVSLLPAYDIYCEWDTVTIHPSYHFDPSVFMDTVQLILTGMNSSAFSMPRIGHTNSNYGLRQRNPHFGVDIHLETGDTVLSAFDGMVRIAKRNKSYGNVVIIRHKNGLETIYAHLSKLLVRTDQYVKAGDVIGLGGNTGHSYGSHLHFEVRYKGEPLDPNELISFDEHKLKGDTVTLSYKSFEFYDRYLRQPATVRRKGSLYYTVKKGDTIYAIARRFGKTPAQICRINKISTTMILHVGTVLRCG
jgi:hypothetical protein